MVPGPLQRPHLRCARWKPEIWARTAQGSEPLRAAPVGVWPYSFLASVLASFKGPAGAIPDFGPMVGASSFCAPPKVNPAFLAGVLLRNMHNTAISTCSSASLCISAAHPGKMGSPANSAPTRCKRRCEFHDGREGARVPVEHQRISLGH